MHMEEDNLNTLQFYFSIINICYFKFSLVFLPIKAGL